MNSIDKPPPGTTVRILVERNKWGEPIRGEAADVFTGRLGVVHEEQDDESERIAIQLGDDVQWFEPERVAVVRTAAKGTPTH